VPHFIPSAQATSWKRVRVPRTPFPLTEKPLGGTLRFVFGIVHLRKRPDFGRIGVCRLLLARPSNDTRRSAGVPQRRNRDRCPAISVQMRGAT